MAQTLIDRICDNCQKSFKARPIDASRGKARYCSRQCLYIGMKKGTDRPHAAVTKMEGGSVRVVRDGLYYTIIDECDLDWFLDFPGGWCTSGHGYIQSSRTQDRLHRLIVRPAKGHQVDHRNRDTRDNRRSNLREATPRQNTHNSGTTNKHGFTGIVLIQWTGKFGGIIKCPDGNRRSIGSYDTPEDAARARDILAHKWRGEFAYLNFPDRLMTDAEVANYPRLVELLGSVHV